MTEEERFVDFATVRTMLLEAEKRRKNLTYEQKAALQHAEWAASDIRNGYRTEPAIFEELRAALLNVETLSKHPSLAAKLAELIPLHPEDVRAVLGSKRIAIDDSEISAIIDIVKQVIGFIE